MQLTFTYAKVERLNKLLDADAAGKIIAVQSPLRRHWQLGAWPIAGCLDVPPEISAIREFREITCQYLEGPIFLTTAFQPVNLI